MITHIRQIFFLPSFALLLAIAGCGNQTEETHPAPDTLVQQQAAMKPLPRGTSTDTLIDDSRPPINEFDTPYLFPHEHPDLPAHIADWLDERGYVVPQLTRSLSVSNLCPCNAISGEFKKKGQTDWAVYCTNREKTRLFVFWAGQVTNIDTISRAPTSINYRHEFGNWELPCCSYYISPADSVNIEKMYNMLRYPDDDELPPINHQGIYFGIYESGAKILYSHKDKWWVLPGSD